MELGTSKSAALAALQVRGCSGCTAIERTGAPSQDAGSKLHRGRHHSACLSRSAEHDIVKTAEAPSTWPVLAPRVLLRAPVMQIGRLALRRQAGYRAAVQPSLWMYRAGLQHNRFIRRSHNDANKPIRNRPVSRERASIAGRRLADRLRLR